MMVRLGLGSELEDEYNENVNPINPYEVVSDFFYDSIQQSQGSLETSILGNLLWIEHLMCQEHNMRNRSSHNALRVEVTHHIWYKIRNQSIQ